MVAERDVSEGEEILHSYGTDLASAQLLQTFGFVPSDHSEASASLARLVASGGKPKANARPTTPVGLRTRDHLIGASGFVKGSPLPVFLVNEIKKDRMLARNNSHGGVRDDEDLFWEIRDIPDRSLASNGYEDDNEFLASLGEGGDDDDAGWPSMLTEDTITLLAAQFLPEDAFLEIFPQTTGSASGVIRLDRSILQEDFFLGMLVCKSLLVALVWKAAEYDGTSVTKTSSSRNDENKPGVGGDIEVLGDEPAGSASSPLSVDAVVEAIVGGGDPLSAGRYLSTILEEEAGRIEALLAGEERTDHSLSLSHFATVQAHRELYGRTVRAEELSNLGLFCQEIEDLIKDLSLGGGLEIHGNGGAGAVNNNASGVFEEPSGGNEQVLPKKRQKVQ